MEFYCDKERHLICEPYSIDNLHAMAKKLNIKRCWFHYKPNNRSHYDIPKQRIEEIKSKSNFVNRRKIIEIMKNSLLK